MIVSTNSIRLCFIGVFFGILFSFILSRFGYYERIKNNYINWMYDADCNFQSHSMSPLNVKMTSTRILCWIMTGPDNHKSRAIYVRDTWGKRCDKLIFMSSQNDSSLPAIALPVGEGRENLWAKTKEAFKYIYKQFYNDYDWFFKVDDDSYVIIDNLRLYLSKENPLDSKWYGYRYRPFVKQGFMSGAAYVLSKEAVRRFVENGIDNSKFCRQDAGGNEDVEIGACMEKLNVLPVDTRDIFGRDRFLPSTPAFHLIPKVLPDDHWWMTHHFYPVNIGPGCCSSLAISFHYVKGNTLYFFEYFLYKLRIYGVDYDD